MAIALKQIKEETKDLSLKEKADLAIYLIKELEPFEKDENHEKLWSETIHRRREELKSGKVTGPPWSEIEQRHVRH